jgi:L-asparaginase
MTKPVVYIVATGGTIASRYNAKTGELVAAASAEELAATVAGITEFAEVRALQHSNVTSDIIDTPTVFRLRDVLRDVLAGDRVAGAVVTHGTATLEETAYFLDLTLGSEKPVVVTGAMRNIIEKDADGPRNIFYSAMVALHPDTHGRGVLVCLNGEIHSAQEAIKSHANRVNAYVSRDGGPVGAVFSEGVVFFSRPERRIYLDVKHVKENVQLVTMAQGANDLLLRACIREKVDGIVVEGVGAGNVNLPFYYAIRDALQAGIPVVVGVRILAGTGYHAKGHEGSLRSMIEHGAISAGYLSGAKARILLMVALAQTQDRNELRDIFRRAAGPSLPS